MTHAIRVFMASAVLGGAFMVASPSPAEASCTANPLPSPYAFIGKVVATKWDGRFARVRTTSGKLVVVKGTADPHQVTSVDRFYQVNRRYEFHPLNSRSPYRDNACTATHPLY
jgi:hypothetical protein